MRNYMKNREKKVNILSLSADELIARVSHQNMLIGKRQLFVLLALFLLIPVFHLMLSNKSLKDIEDNNISMVSLAMAPVSVTNTKKDLISIPSGVVKANPFLPYRDIGGSTLVNDVPKYDLVAPPEVVNENSEAARVMDTVVSGILYDKYSPSAILNIEGNDYLVKKGDVVNNYKILAIMQDSVTVKLGSSTYKAGIGEILTEGTINHNEVSNLSKKFGGEKR